MLATRPGGAISTICTGTEPGGHDEATAAQSVASESNLRSSPFWNSLPLADPIVLCRSLRFRRLTDCPSSRQCHPGAADLLTQIVGRMTCTTREIEDYTVG